MSRPRVSIAHSVVLWFGLAAVAARASPLAPEPLTRARAIRLAVAQNPQVAAARAEIARAAAVKGEADALRWPNLDFTAGMGPAQQARLAPGTAVQSTQSAYTDVDDLSVFVLGQLRVIQPIYTFGKINLRRDAAQHGIRAAEAQAQITQADIAFRVAELYEGYMLADASLAFFQEAQHIAENAVQEALTKQRNNSPSFNEVDLLQLQTAQGEVQLAINEAEAGRKEAAIGLRAYLDLQANEPLAVPSAEFLPLSQEGAPQPQEFVPQALELRPEIRALAEGQAAYRRLAQAERAAYWPDFFVMLLIDAAYTPYRDLVNTRYVVDPFYHFVPGLVAGLHWSFTGPTPTERARQMAASEENLQALERWARLGIPAEVRVACEDVTRAQEDLKQAKATFPKAKQWVVRASADYAVGMGSARGLTDAVTAYILIRTQIMDATFRTNVGLAKLAKVSGTLVTGKGPYPNGEQ
jgi:outer membrane protein TolC